jgi:hypothetical protein
MPLTHFQSSKLDFKKNFNHKIQYAFLNCQYALHVDPY